MSESVHVGLSEVRRSRGAAVFLPGPMKLLQRCQDKIDADYAEKEPWPPAASVLDLVRCTVVMDDPYAMALFVAYAVLVAIHCVSVGAVGLEELYLLPL